MKQEFPTGETPKSCLKEPEGEATPEARLPQRWAFYLKARLLSEASLFSNPSEGSTNRALASQLRFEVRLLKEARRRGYSNPKASLLSKAKLPRGKPILHARLAVTGHWQANFALKWGCLKKPGGEAPFRGEPIPALRRAFYQRQSYPETSLFQPKSETIPA